MPVARPWSPLGAGLGRDIVCLGGAGSSASGGGLIGAIGSGLKALGWVLGFFDEGTSFVPMRGRAIEPTTISATT